MNEVKPNNSIKKNEEYLRSIIGTSSDVIYRHFFIPGLNNSEALLVYIDGLTNAKKIDDYILRPLTEKLEFTSKKSLPGKNNPTSILMQSGVLTPSVMLSTDWNEICNLILSGDCILFINDSDEAVINSVRGWDTRSISEPISDAEIRGARDGFVESIRTNTALIRRRVRDFELRFDSYQIGKRTKTDIALVYIDSLVDKGVLNELEIRLKRIDTDSILESAYIEEFIEDSPFSLFPQIQNTERPDKVAASILEGKIAIIVDNTPFVLIVPTVFWDAIQASGDYFERHYIGTFFRMIRILALILAFTLPSLYVMMASFHQEMLPTPIAMKLAAGREGVPFPAVLEAFVMEVMFEILREAGIRIPKPIGQAVSIVGALVIGEAAVQAGIVAPLLVIIVAASGICSFAIPGNNLTLSMRVARFFLLFATGILGVLGFLAVTVAVVLHLLSLRSFGAPYLAPLSPFRFQDFKKDFLVRSPWWNMTNRPSTSRAGRKTRQGGSSTLKPQPKK